MCLSFFKLNRPHLKKCDDISKRGFSRITYDCDIDIDEHINEYAQHFIPTPTDTPFIPLLNLSSHSMNDSMIEPVLNSKINTLNDPPQLIRGYPKPLHYFSKQQHKHFIVITTSYHHTAMNNKNNNKNGCVYLYDIFENSYHSIPYPANLKPEYHGHCIDHQSGFLYIFFGRHRVFATLDLENNHWDVKCAHNDSDFSTILIHKYNIKNIWYPSSYYIPSPVNEIHIFGESMDGDGTGCHMKYDQLTNKFIELHLMEDNKDIFVASDDNDDGDEDDDDEMCPDLDEANLCYIQHRKQLLVLNGDNYGENTWCLDFDLYPKWKLLDIAKNSGDSVVLFDRLILVRRGECIWCMDLRQNCDSFEYQWIQSEMRMMGVLMETFMVKVTDYFVHFINCLYSYHTKLWFYYLLPMNIQKQFNNMIAFGYTKNEYTEKLISNIITDVIGEYIDLMWDD